MDQNVYSKTKIRVKNVHFDGVKKTNARILAKIIRPIYEAQTIEQCVDKLDIVIHRMNSLNSFNRVTPTINILTERGTQDDSIKDIDLTFSVSEKNNVTGGVETTVDDRRSASISVKLALPNVTGAGDSIGTELRKCKGKTLGEVNYSRLYVPWWDICSPRHTTSLYVSDSTSTSSGYNQKDRGISTQLDMNIAKNLHHSLNFDNVWRDIRCSAFDTPFKIREQSGHSFKTSAKYTLTHDTRDVPTFSTKGHMIRMSVEHAGLFKLGDINFTKSDIHLQVNQPIIPKLDISCQGSMQFGLIHPHPGNYLICDKYFAGGPLTVRGFKQNGIGPHCEKYALGARAFWAAGIHMYSRLPFVSSRSSINDFIRPHLFVNSGSAVDFGLTKDLNKDFKSLTSRARLSYGFGLVLYFSSIRLELNYCIPRTFHKGDQTEEGFQYGLGVLFT